ncbi:MAG: alpha/beta hydrolase [Peptococcaceae bacterium]|nr:alpha/beta hydrolase [Peptococcaceae bacterium]
MPINRYMHTALKTLSNIPVDVKTDYQLIRRIQRIAKKPRLRLTYQTWNSHIKNGSCTIPIRLFSPVGRKITSLANAGYPLIIFLHGGGWVTEDLETYEKTCRIIARQTRHILIAVDYRLAPEYPFPAALEDCYKAVRTIMRWHRISGSSHKIALMGDSAGGNLAAAVSLYMRDRGEKTVDRQVLIYPATYNDHTETSPFPSVAENGTDYILTSKHLRDYMDLYCRGADRDSPYCAPLLANDFSNQPDTLILTAQYDPLRDEGEEYGRKLQAAGNSVWMHRIDALHGYFSLPLTFAAVKESYTLINQFLWEDEGPHE